MAGERVSSASSYKGVRSGAGGSGHVTRGSPLLQARCERGRNAHYRIGLTAGTVLCARRLAIHLRRLMNNQLLRQVVKVKHPGEGEQYL